MKLISFTLYGNDKKYIEGMYKNIPLKKEFYPDWQIIVYHDDSLEENVVSKLSKDCILRNVQGCGISAAAWRFLAHEEDCERFIVRDSDSRISQREATAVAEWEESNKTLHIMRDHPHHGHAILGGMWGMIKDKNITSMKNLILSYQNTEYHVTDRDVWIMKDMHFLRDVIYPNYNPSNCMIHNAKDFMSRVPWRCEEWAVDFSTTRNDNKNFVGEIFVFDQEGNEKREYQYKEL
jgi:hypothetical protein